MMAVTINPEWFLDHQDEARAYRATKVKIPKLGFTIYKDSIQMKDPVRNIHMACDRLFHGDLEQHRVREPFVGVDFFLIHGEMRLERKELRKKGGRGKYES